MSDTPRIEVKQVDEGFVSVHIYEPDDTHWSNGTMAQSDHMYGPFTPEVDEWLHVSLGVLVVVYADPKKTCVELKGDDEDREKTNIVLPRGETFRLLARTSVSYVCIYNPPATAEEVPSEEPDSSDGLSAEQAKEAASFGDGSLG